ncbi:MAG TPA: hypothetical protein VM842_08030 [Nitrospira sp.]|nr:hypothetical protein [Nitrospira sp.]
MFLIWGGVAYSSAADSSQERIALSFSGADCSSQRRSIGVALAGIPGVNHVDVDSVPDHALVDVANPAVTSDTLTTVARRNVAFGTQCLVETMKSCISANLIAVGR